MQPQYAPQYPAQPVAPAYPQQPYPQQYQPAPAYAQPPAPQAYAPAPAYPQQYAQPQYAQPAPPAAPLPTGTLDSFYEQPSSGGGPSFKFMDANRTPQIGKSYAGIVARPVTNADVRAQTDNSGRVQTYKDGRPKFALVVPLLVQASPEFPEGQAGWWVKGQARDELARAMSEAGAPAGPPEAGAGIRVTLVGVRPVPNMSPAFQYRVDYMRPNGAAPVVTQAAAQAPVAQPVQQYAQPSTVPPVTPYAAANPGTGAYGDGPYIAPGTPVAPAPAPVPAPVQQQMPTGFDADQQALLARLTGQPVPAQG